MKNIIALLLLIGLASCSNETLTSKATNSHNVNNMVDVEKWINELMDVDSILINDKLKVITSKAIATEAFSLPNKIIEIDESKYLAYLLKEDENLIPYHIVYRGISFDGINDKLILKRITFDEEDLVLNTPFLELKKGVHIREICELYPESCKLIILGGNTWTGHIELRASKKAMLEDLRWFLIFKNESLIGVELHRFF